MVIIMKDLDKLTESVTEKLGERGAQLSHCSATVRETKEFNVDGGEFSLLRTLFDNSLSVTAVKDGKKGSVGLNNFSDEAVEKEVKSVEYVNMMGQRSLKPFEGVNIVVTTFTDGTTKAIKTIK